MKIKILALALLSAIGANAQLKTQGYIPQDVNFVYKINTGNLLKKISLETAEEYAFMQNIAQEISNGKTSRISELGLDETKSFTQFVKLDGLNTKVGFNFAIKDIDAFFNNTGFPKSLLINLKDSGVAFRNNMVYVFQNNTLTLMMVQTDHRAIRSYCDSVYDANGWDKGYYYDPYADYEEVAPAEAYDGEITETYVEAPNLEEDVIAIPKPKQEEPVAEEIITEEVEEEISEVIYVPEHPNYYDYQDSIRKAWSLAAQSKAVDEIKEGIKLNSGALEFLESEKDATFYFLQDYQNMEKIIPMLAREINLPKDFLEAMLKLSEGNEFYASFDFTDEGFDINSTVQYNGFLADVTELIEYDKVDKKLLNYIPGTSKGYLLLNNNSYETYEAIKAQLLPELEESEGLGEKNVAYVWYTLDNFMDMEAFYQAFPSELVFSYNGFTEQKVQRVHYSYDENFNSIRSVEERLEKLPSFSLTMHTEDATFLEKTLKHLTVTFGEYIQKVENYYVIKTPSMPNVYVRLKGNYILASNDIAHITTYANGYGKENGLPKAEIKTLKKIKGVYAMLDYGALLKSFPLELTGERAQLEMMQYTPYLGKISLHQTIDKGEGKLILNYKMKSDAPNGIYGALNIIDIFYNNEIKH